MSNNDGKFDSDEQRQYFDQLCRMAGAGVKGGAEEMSFLSCLSRYVETHLPKYKNPKPTVDAVIFMSCDYSDPRQDRIILIKRKNPPHGWAFPGGFVNEGERFRDAVQREALEETGLHVTVTIQLHTYSDPDRDPRQHNASTVYLTYLAPLKTQTPVAADDAAELKIVTIGEALEMDLAFDHHKILNDVLRFRQTGDRPWKS